MEPRSKCFQNFLLVPLVDSEWHHLGEDFFFTFFSQIRAFNGFKADLHKGKFSLSCELSCTTNGFKTKEIYLSVENFPDCKRALTHEV